MIRADISLPYDECSKKLSINERRRRYEYNIPKDEELLVYAWQMARYTLVCSSRSGTLPANLQAIWSNHIISAWSCDYHTNINLQENYWGAEVANLSDCHLPLFDYMNSYLLESGKETAKIGYNARGTVVHHLSDIYGFTAPADGLWGIWSHGASWLSYHMWEHYLFTNDREFLKNTAYEFIHQAAIFFLDTMVEDDNGQLLFGPSMSPENFYWTTNEKGERVRCVLTMSSAMDTQIIDGLLRIYADASKILGIDNDDVRAATKARKKLPPQKVGKFGQIMEWMEDYEENEVAHRHISPAFAMYPDNAINRKTPELYNAIDVTLTRRTTGKADGGGPSSILDMGLTLVWIIALYARLRRGEECGAYSNALYSKLNDKFLYVYPGTDIFQVDATLGFLGAFSEMFIQSHEDVISLIPAIPKKWDSGSFYGLRARGGFEVSVK